MQSLANLVLRSPLQRGPATALTLLLLGMGFSAASLSPATPSEGDVGLTCDPANPSGCDYACLELGDGGGVCVDTCGDMGHVSCPEDYACNDRLDSDGQPVQICLPNASCGDLTFQGYCDDAVLHYCDTEGPISFDCSSVAGENGEPLKCAEVSAAYGSDCVSSTFSTGCGSETLAGRCDGNTVVRCEAYATGQVLRENCPSGQECAQGEDGSTYCRQPGTQGCGNVTYQGYCDGDVVVWCNPDDGVTRSDCASDSQTCGWVDDNTGYWCVAPVSISTGTFNVRGRFMYEKKQLTPDGLRGSTTVPVRQALVQIRRSSDNQIVASAITRDSGDYAVGFETSEAVYVMVLAAAETDLYSLSVRDNPMNSGSATGNIYSAASADFAPQAQHNLGSLTIPSSGVAGAFNIFDVAIRGIDFAWRNLGSKPPSVILQWAAGSNTMCGTSCFSSYPSNTIYVLGTYDDTDEFDDPVLGHEFGHFLESAFSRSDSPGGSHDGSPTDPRLAWGEGYGTFVGSVLFGSPLYIDSRSAGAMTLDISNVGARADPGSSRGMTQLLGEYLVAESLWHISMGGPSTGALGTEDIFDVLGHYFTSVQLADRGVDGVDLVDFLDGWFCRGHGQSSTIRSIIVDQHSFPYDFSGPDSCP